MNFPSKNINFSIAGSDHYFKQVLVKSLLINPFYRNVKNCNNGHELIKQLYIRKENVFFIDLYMPIMTGLEAIKFIRNSGNQTPIITYSATYQEDMHAILKSFPSVYYCEKKSVVILDILKNYVTTNTKCYSTYLEEWEKQPLTVYKQLENQEKERNLPSLLEIQIMKLCYEGFTNKEIGEHLNLSGRTIDAYVAKLIDKLNLRNKIDLVRYCVERGYYNFSE